MYSIVNKKRLSFDYGLAIIIRKMNIAVNEKKFLLPQTYCVTKHFLGSLCVLMRSESLTTYIILDTRRFILITRITEHVFVHKNILGIFLDQHGTQWQVDYSKFWKPES